MRKTILLSLISASTLAAQDAAMTAEQTGATRNSALGGELGFGFTDQYFFRGLKQEQSGLITQPWINLHYDLYESDSGLQDLRLVFGQWNSLHSGRTGPGGAIWYESRFWLGVDAQFNDRFRAGLRFNTYANPNGAAGTLTNIEELQFDFAYDDSGMLSEDFSLQPYATLAFELSNQRDSGLGGPGFDKGIYLEVGVNPSMEIAQIGDSAVTLSAPTRFGFSLGDYYENATGSDDFFGYFQTGAIASTPLDFLTPRLGPWIAEAGLNFIVLGDNNDALNSGDNAELWFSLNFRTSF